MRSELKEQRKYLKQEYQPQWHFRTKASAKKELSFQKEANPDTYKWLMTKKIRVGGKRVYAKQVIKSRRVAPRNAYGISRNSIFSGRRRGGIW